VGGLPRLDPARPERLGERRELGGGSLGDLFNPRPRFQPLGVDEQGLEDLPVLLLRQVREGEGMNRLGRPGEVGVDLEPVHVGDDEQGRVVERLPVAQELVVGGLQVLVLPLVLPGEVALLPDVGPAFAAAVLGCPLLEGVGGPLRVRVGGGRLSEHPAQVDEVLLGARSFLEIRGRPLPDELLGGHQSPPGREARAGGF